MAAGPAWAQASGPPPGPAAPPGEPVPPLLPLPPPGLPGQAWVVVDAGTGAVLDGFNARVPVPPASLTKLLTALAVISSVPSGAAVPVSPRAAAMPASRVDLRTGQAWSLDDTLHALLLTSANDAAMALAERSATDAESFSSVLDTLARHLGLRDNPVLRDPAGLDGPLGVGGGNMVSATDLAIAARAALAEPRLSSTWGLREYRFTAPDGTPRRLVNHNKHLWSYPGTVGGKTGYTRRAGHCLLTVATRDGRTLIAVILNVPDRYGLARVLLDRGFATPPPVAPVDRLPPVRQLVTLRPTPVAAAKTEPVGDGPVAVPVTAAAATSVLLPSRPLLAASAALSMLCALAMLALVKRERYLAMSLSST